VGSETAAERGLASIQDWIEKQLRLKVNRDKSGKGKAEERKFLGFRLNRQGQIEAAPETIERFKTKVRQMWRSCQSKTSEQLRDAWQRYVQGWWGYYRLAEERQPIFGLEGWIRRHIRKCFWLRWHNARGRQRALRRLGVHPALLHTVHTSRGAWRMAQTPTLCAGLKNATLRRYGFWMPSDLADPQLRPLRLLVVWLVSNSTAAQARDAGIAAALGLLIYAVSRIHKQP
jgi:hypothetical protein